MIDELRQLLPLLLCLVAGVILGWAATISIEHVNWMICTNGAF